MDPSDTVLTLWSYPSTTQKTKVYTFFEPWTCHLSSITQ